MIGEGKYDGECNLLQKGLNAQGVLLIVLNGNRGSGFSAAIDLKLVPAIPSVLRETADQIERDAAKLPKN